MKESDVEFSSDSESDFLDEDDEVEEKIDDEQIAAEYEAMYKKRANLKTRAKSNDQIFHKLDFSLKSRDKYKNMSEEQVKEHKKQAKIKRKARKAKEKKEIIKKLLATKQKRPVSEVVKKAQDELDKNVYKPKNMFETPVVRYINSSISGNTLVIPSDVKNINQFFGVER
mmetsp:Transcript_10175/g.14908  ORF Transcript_10175/g.14908 Transcript_10175/m.14908 type:complete len:170 (-) Transcript_10175:1381-1890(-)